MQADEARPLLLGLVDGHERARCASIARVHREDALVAAERALGVPQLRLVDGRGAEAQDDLELGILAALCGAAEDVDQALPVTGVGVELFEPLPVSGGDECLPQSAERAAVLGIDLEDSLPRGRSPVRIAEVVAVRGA